MLRAVEHADVGSVLASPSPVRQRPLWITSEIDRSLREAGPMPHRPATPVAQAPAVPGFELGERIGVGATSEVWAAVSEAGGRRVAVKVVHADLAELDAAAREAALSAVAASAHVVHVEACLPLVDGRVALVMPWLQGVPSAISSRRVATSSPVRSSRSWPRWPPPWPGCTAPG